MFQVKKIMLKKLNELFDIDYVLEHGDETIFYYMKDNELVSAFINNDNYADLNMDYFIGYSADKYISPLLDKMNDYDVDLDTTSLY